MTASGGIVDVLSWIAIVGGSAFLVIGAVGLIRFPEFWSRLHAISVLDSAGVLLLLLGMGLQGGLSLVTVKLVILGLFLLITGPTATHAVANAAFVSGLRPPIRSEDRAAVAATAAAATREPPASDGGPASGPSG
ncbi:MAG: monovalent cation/H(+) antiporter subunit G [Paracoccaceae bacterium]|nr:monovalent cation/H(+) antiporter subunit G [Paracoccaceae bacterium]MDE2915098.1 monovalent cation/H(+) antiporter subunit G [Paracoccaceae bacterium]